MELMVLILMVRICFENAGLLTELVVKHGCIFIENVQQIYQKQMF
jgi:hypothetical protein